MARINLGAVQVVYYQSLIAGRFFLGLIIVPQAITILDMVAIVELQQSTRS